MKGLDKRFLIDSPLLEDLFFWNNSDFIKKFKDSINSWESDLSISFFNFTQEAKKEFLLLDEKYQQRINNKLIELNNVRWEELIYLTKYIKSLQLGDILINYIKIWKFRIFLKFNWEKYTIVNILNYKEEDVIKELINQITDDILVVITWKSWSWKTTLRKKLEENWFTPLITTTSRKPREGEQEWIDYNFIKIEEFQDNNFYLVWTNENWDKYWIDANYFNEKWKKVLVTWRWWVEELSDMVKEEILKYRNIILVHLDFSNFTLIRRLLKRWDKKENIRKRLKSDNKKFDKFNTDLESIVIRGWNIEEIEKTIIFELIKRYPIPFMINITNN